MKGVILMFCCRTTRLANYLLKNGCTMLRIDSSHDNTRFLVFMFKQNEILEENLKRWETDKNTFIC